jgi:putative autoinducer-2 (AI-2) aldolase
MGRNIWQSKHPVPMIRAVRAIVHGNVNVKEAYDLFNRLCKESPSKNDKPKSETSQPKNQSNNKKQKKK